MKIVFKNKLILICAVLSVLFLFSACSEAPPAEQDDQDQVQVEQPTPEPEPEPQPEPEPEPESFPSSIVGAWDNDEAEFSRTFFEDGTFTITSSGSLETGSYAYDSAIGKVLMIYDNVPVGHNMRNCYIDTSGHMLDEGNESTSDFYYQVDEASYIEQFSIVGAWDNDDIETSIIFYEDGTFEQSASYFYKTGTYMVDYQQAMFVMRDDSGFEEIGSINGQVFSTDAFYGDYYSVDAISYLYEDGDATLTSVVGAWDNDEAKLSIIFDDNGTYSLHSPTDRNTANGYYYFDEQTFILSIQTDSNERFDSLLDANTFTYGDMVGAFHAVSEPGYRYQSDAFPDTIAGSWDSHEDESSYIFHGDGAFEQHFAANMLTGRFTYEPEFGVFVLVYPDRVDGYGYVDENGHLYIEGSYADVMYELVDEISYRYNGN